MGTLYLVATPIGNLEDVTLRALRVLREVTIIAAEDTRDARRLLAHYKIRAPRLVSYTDHNARSRIPQILAALDTDDIALVSDAGMPGISDPGYELVAAAAEAGHMVVPVAGVTAVIAAVAASGLPSRRFHYLGFLPRQRGARKAALRSVASGADTVVIYESPHRLRATLEDVRDVLGDRRIAIGRELTKLHEEVWRGSVSGALSHFEAPRGEFTLVVEGATFAQQDDRESDEEAIAAVVGELRSKGVTAKAAVAALSERFRLSRREAYRRWHEPD